MSPDQSQQQSIHSENLILNSTDEDNNDIQGRSEFCIYYLVCQKISQCCKYICAKKNQTVTTFLTGFENLKSNSKQKISIRYLKYQEFHQNLVYFYNSISQMNAVINQYLAGCNAQFSNTYKNPELEMVNLIICIEKLSFNSLEFSQDFQKKTLNNKFKYCICYTDLRDIVISGDSMIPKDKLNLNFLYFSNCIFSNNDLPSMYIELQRYKQDDIYGYCKTVEQQEKVLFKGYRFSKAKQIFGTALTCCQQNSQTTQQKDNNQQMTQQYLTIPSCIEGYQIDTKAINFQRIFVVLEDDKYNSEYYTSALQTIIKTYEKINIATIVDFKMNDQQFERQNILNLSKAIQKVKTQNDNAIIGVSIQMLNNIQCVCDIISLLQSRLIETATETAEIYQTLDVKYFLIYFQNTKYEPCFSFTYLNFFNYVHGVVVMTSWKQVPEEENRNKTFQPLILFHKPVHQNDCSILSQIINNFDNLISLSYQSEVKYHIIFYENFEKGKCIVKLFQQDQDYLTHLHRSQRQIITKAETGDIHDLKRLYQQNRQEDVQTKFKIRKQIAEQSASELIGKVSGNKQQQNNNIQQNQNEAIQNQQSIQCNQNCSMPSKQTAQSAQKLLSAVENNTENQNQNQIEQHECQSIENQQNKEKEQLQQIEQQKMERMFSQIYNCIQQHASKSHQYVQQVHQYVFENIKDIYQFVQENKLSLQCNSDELNQIDNQYTAYVTKIIEQQNIHKLLHYIQYTYSVEELIHILIKNIQSEYSILLDYIIKYSKTEEYRIVIYMDPLSFCQKLMIYYKKNGLLEKDPTYCSDCICKPNSDNQLQCSSTCSCVKAKTQCELFKHLLSIDIKRYFLCGNQTIYLNSYCFDVKIMIIPGVGFGLVSTAYHKPEENIVYGEYKGDICTNDQAVSMLQNNGSDMYYAFSTSKHAIWAAKYGGYMQFACNVHFFNNTQFTDIFDGQSIIRIILKLIKPISENEGITVDYNLDTSGIEQRIFSQCKCWALCGISHRISRGDFQEKYELIINSFIELLKKYYSDQLQLSIPQVNDLKQLYMTGKTFHSNIDVFVLALVYQLYCTYGSQTQPIDTIKNLISKKYIFGTNNDSNTNKDYNSTINQGFNFDEYEKHYIKHMMQQDENNARLQQQNVHTIQPKLIKGLSLLESVFYEFISQAQSDLMLTQDQYYHILCRDYNQKWANLMYHKQFYKQKIHMEYKAAIKNTKQSINNLLVLSHNIKSFEDALEHGFDQYIQSNQFDLICLQEPHSKLPFDDKLLRYMEYLNKQFKQNFFNYGNVGYFCRKQNKTNESQLNIIQRAYRDCVDSGKIANIFFDSRSFQVIQYDDIDDILFIQLYAPTNISDNIQFINNIFIYAKEIENLGQRIILFGDFNVNMTQKVIEEYQNLKPKRKSNPLIYNINKDYNFLHQLEINNYIDINQKHFDHQILTQHNKYRNDLILVSKHNEDIIQNVYIDNQHYFHNNEDHVAIIFEVNTTKK